MSRVGRWVLAVAVVQLAVIGLYLLVDHPRSAETAQLLGTGPPQRVDLPMPTLTLRQRNGRRVELPAGRPTVVHVWATWCPPCRTELPGLLDLEAKHGVEVVALALDRRWADVDELLGDRDAASVFLADSTEVEQALGVTTLPVTFLVDANHRIALRFDGARDWTDEAFVSTHLDVPVGGR